MSIVSDEDYIEDYIDNYIDKHVDSVDPTYKWVREAVVVNKQFGKFILYKAILNHKEELIGYCLNIGIKECIKRYPCTSEMSAYDVLFSSIHESGITIEKLNTIFKIADLFNNHDVEKFVTDRPNICFVGLVYSLEKHILWKLPDSFDEIKDPILIRFPGCGDNGKDDQEFFWVSEQEYLTIKRIIPKLNKHEIMGLIVEEDCSGCIININLIEGVSLCEIVPGTMDQTMKEYIFSLKQYKFWTKLRERFPEYYFTTTDHRPLLLKLQKLMNECVCAYEIFCCTHSHVEIGDRIEI